jgi:hypothetical protein
MARKRVTGRSPRARDLAEAKRVAALHPDSLGAHPSAMPADRSRLDHINTYGALPEYYVDKPFKCRDCGKEEIWRAKDQKWYYEEAKGHIDATAVRCRACRKRKKGGRATPAG